MSKITRSCFFWLEGLKTLGILVFFSIPDESPLSKKHSSDGYWKPLQILGKTNISSVCSWRPNTKVREASSWGRWILWGTHWKSLGFLMFLAVQTCQSPMLAACPARESIGNDGYSETLENYRKRNHLLCLQLTSKLQRSRVVQL